ncbi:MAG TPA: hypothetical protein VHT52_02790 [Stellaceae bacterium]|nr:hypothetical protein [Stellaceae bacterium]
MQQGGGSGSYYLARRQAQTHEVQLALLWVATMRGARRREGCERRTLCTISRFVEPAYLSTAGGEESGSSGIPWKFPR